MNKGMKNHKNIILTLIVTLATLCLCNANIIKEKHTMDNKDEQTPEEIMPNNNDEQDPESIQKPIVDIEKPMAGIIISPKDGEKVELYEKLKPVGGDIIPTKDDDESDSSDDVDDEEILSINIDIPNTKINIPETKQAPLAGKVMPVKEDRRVPGEQILPLAGEVMPLNKDDISQEDYKQVPLAGIDVGPNEYPQNPVNEPTTICGDIPPSYVKRPQNKTGFWKSFLNKFRKDKY